VERYLLIDTVTPSQPVNQLEARRQQLLIEQKMLKERMSKIRHKIAIISGKGGVGKSTVTVNLAVSFAKAGYKVGLLDADIHGPSIPKLLGLKGQRVQVTNQGAYPVTGPYGMKVVSIDFFLSEEIPTIWRGPLKMGAIRQFLQDVIWSELDVLFIDLPPGTGDEPLSIAQLLPEIDGVIVVTMPTELSSGIVKKAITFALRLNMPIIGVVENMGSFVCPHCGIKTEIFPSGGGKKMAQEAGVAFLASLPLDPTVGKDADQGKPFIFAHPESAASKAFTEVTEKVQAYLKQKSKQKQSENSES
jgi:ATP-binding protein involved in chromosome partitioning